MLIQNKIKLLSKGGEDFDKRFKQGLLNKVIAKSYSKNMKRKWFIIPPLALATLIAVFTFSFNSMLGTQSSTTITGPDSSGRGEVALDDVPSSKFSQKIFPDIYPVPPYRDDRVSESEQRYYDTNASITLESNDITSVSTEVRNIVESAGGILSDINLNISDNYKDSAYLTFNVPQEEVFDVIDELKALGYEVTRENLNMRDITVNVEDREQNANQVIENYEQQIENLRDRLENENLTDAQIRQLEQQITNYQGLIEEERERLSEYKGDISYATLSISIVEPESGFNKFFNRWGGTGYFGDLLRSGGVAFIVLFSLLRFVGHVLVWFLVFGIVWIPAWFLIRKFRSRKKD